MQLKRLLRDEAAVTPVIGIILVVAITVILAALVGGFVLEEGQQGTTSPPQASFSFNYSEGGATDSFGSTSGTGLLTIEHQSGQPIPAARLTIIGGPDGEQEVAADSTNSPMYSSGDEITSGDTITYRMDRDDTVKIIWTSADGDESQTIAKYEGPDVS